MTRDLVSGVLLAGGLARRMGGGDKGLALLGGVSLAARTLAALSPQCAQVYINANRNIPEYKKLGHPIAPDSVSDFAGPLAGILAGMSAAQTDWILSVPCDSPFLPSDLRARLWETMEQTESYIVTAHAGGRSHPVFMLARRTLRDDLESFLRGGGRKIDDWRFRHSHAETAFPDPSPFANINTPEELRAMQTRIQI